MSEKTQQAASAGRGGIGFVGLLTIVFITLKLLDKIDWSWVLSPLWISWLFVIALVLGAVIVAIELWEALR